VGTSLHRKNIWRVSGRSWVANAADPTHCEVIELLVFPKRHDPQALLMVEAFDYTWGYSLVVSFAGVLLSKTFPFVHLHPWMKTAAPWEHIRILRFVDRFIAPKIYRWLHRLYSVQTGRRQ
jgi:hypothetical protein